MYPRTWIGWTVLIILVWFVVTMPETAGGDVGGIGHWLTHALHQASIFVRSIH